jgi:hypothetical protein
VLHIGNELFGWFKSTKSKSRINFLECLHAGERSTQLNEEAWSYMQEQGLSAVIQEQLKAKATDTPMSLQVWYEHLIDFGIKDERHVRIATEGALLGSLLEKVSILNWSLSVTVQANLPSSCTHCAGYTLSLTAILKPFRDRRIRAIP